MEGGSARSEETGLEMGNMGSLAGCGCTLYWAFEYAADYDCVHSPTPAVLRHSHVWILLSLSIATMVVRLLICQYVRTGSAWDYPKIELFFNLSGVCNTISRGIPSRFYINWNLITLHLHYYLID